MTDQIEVKGFIDRVVSTYPESGWCAFVLKCDDQDGKKGAKLKVTGTCPNVREQMCVRIKGEMIMHPKFGEQLKAEFIEPIEPDTDIGLQKFLSADFAKNIGPDTARRIVKHFGKETLQIIREHPERLMEVSGMGAVRVDKLRAALARWDESHDILLDLMRCGLTPKKAQRLTVEWGAKAAEKLRENPYRLTVLSGFGFLTADRIAQRIGVPADSPYRINAGLFHCLGQLADFGHTWTNEEELTSTAVKLLGIHDATIRGSIGKLPEKFPGLVSKEGGRIGLTMLWDAEREISKRISILVNSPGRATETGLAFNVSEAEGEIMFSGEQRQAIFTALTSKVAVITGGPGTGKTTIIKAIVSLAFRQAISIALCAPTGRAARRMSEACDGQLAQTVHRMLAWNPSENTFQFDETNPLHADLVIVDEASMLDVQLTAHLMRAVRPDASIVFVGDSDQLPSVGPGAVLRDLIACDRMPTVPLKIVFRQALESGIVTAAHAVNKGKSPVTAGTDFLFVKAIDPNKVLELLHRLLSGGLQKINAPETTDIQILCPQKTRSLGTNAINEVARRLLNPTAKGVKGFAMGDRVMQTRNNYRLGVFNGMVGTVQNVEKESMIVEFDGEPIQYIGPEIKQLVLAYACTIHKSQGSEYEIVVLLVHTQHYVMLQRNLLYTGITRARKLCVVIGHPDAMKKAAKNDRPIRRNTLLAEELRSSVAEKNVSHTW